MKRSIVILLVVLALIVLISPGIVGWLAEKNLEEELAWAKQENPDFVVTTEKFDRGWFTSEGTHRISMRHGDLQSAMAPDEAMPSLIIDTRFDHGLVPFSSMSQPSGSLKPGLARMVSTLHVDDGRGNITNLPGAVYSETSLSGETTGQYLLEPGSNDDGDSVATWGGANLSFVVNNSSRDLSLKGEVQPWSYRSGLKNTDIGLITIDARQTDTQYGFPVGALSMSIDSLTVGGTDMGAGPASEFYKLSINGTSSIERDALQARTQMSLERLVVPGFGDVGLSMDVVAKDLDAAAVGRISKAVNEARASADPAAAVSDLFSVIRPDLEALLAAGGELRFDQLDVSLPQGMIRSNLALTLAKSTGPFSWPGAILATTASADFEIPAMLVEMGRQMNPDAGNLVDMGLLQLDGDVYRMKAAFAGGLLTVNGAPMPLPLPGQ